MFYSSHLQFSVVLIMISKIISQGKQELDNLQRVNNGLMYLEILLQLCLIFITFTVVKEANQSSTNSSFSAGLGCDDDLDTFSVTMGGVNQWWSATLDKEYQISWIFIRIEGGKHLKTIIFQ